MTDQVLNQFPCLGGGVMDAIKPKWATLIDEGKLDELAQCTSSDLSSVFSFDGGFASPLMYAVRKVKLDAVIKLLDLGADPNAAEEGGFVECFLAQP